MVKTTRAQRKALFRVFLRDNPNYETPFKRFTGIKCPHCGEWTGPLGLASKRYKNFRKQVVPYFDKSGCVLLPWKGLWLGIEPDGYTHS